MGRVLHAGDVQQIVHQVGAVALQAQARSENALLGFHPTLDEKVIAENLRDGAVLLQLLAEVAHVLGVGVQKV